MGMSPAERVRILREAIEDLTASTKLKPDHPVPFYTLGLCLLDLAQKGDPFTEVLGPEADEALAGFSRGLELQPGMYQFHSLIGEVNHLKAIRSWEHGDDPEPLFDQAESSFEAAIRMNPDYVHPHINLAWVDYFRAKFDVRNLSLIHI